MKRKLVKTTLEIERKTVRYPEDVYFFSEKWNINGDQFVLDYLYQYE